MITSKDTGESYNEKINKRIPDWLPKIPFRIACIGKSKSGKSTVICNFFNDDMYGKNTFRKEDIFVFSQTNTLDNKLKDWVPAIDENYITDFDENIIDDIYKQQKALHDTYGKKRVPPILIILDDMIGTSALRDRNIITKMMPKTRHYNVSYLITTQKFSGIPRQIRLNCCTMLIFKVVPGEIDAILNELSDKKSRNKLRSILVKIFSEPYQFLMIDFMTSNMDKTYRIGLHDYFRDPVYDDS